MLVDEVLGPGYDRRADLLKMLVSTPPWLEDRALAALFWESMTNLEVRAAAELVGNLD